MLPMFFFSLENCYLTSPADFAPLPADVSSSSSDCSDRVAAAACCTHTLADFISGCCTRGVTDGASCLLRSQHPPEAGAL